MGWLDLATASLSLVLYSLKWIFFSTANLVVSFVRLVAWPLGALCNALLVVFAPVIYTVRFLLWPLFALVQNLPRLEPLYIYFGSAAFVGIAVGILVRLTTQTTFTLLGLYDTGKPHARPYPAGASAQDTQLSLSQKSHDSRPITPMGSEQKELDALLAGISSSPESDHLVAALQGVGAGWRDSPNTKRKRKSASGLRGAGLGSSRFGTILEEDDDSL